MSVPSLGSLAFLNPWLLVALPLLPALWWLLRVTPPAPRRLRFPPIRLLLGLPSVEETPARTPLWLALLRLALAALVVLALAHPVLGPGARLAGDGPVWLVVDDGWAAARGWTQRRAAMAAVIDQAERAGRPVALLTTAAPASGEPAGVLGPMAAAAARRIAQALEPKPWPVDREAALTALEAALPAMAPGAVAAGRAAAGKAAGEAGGKASGKAGGKAAGEAIGRITDGAVVWISDGIADGAGFALAQALRRLGEVRILAAARGDLPHLLLPPHTGADGLSLRAARPGPDGDDRLDAIWVRAMDAKGRLLTRARLAFAGGETRSQAAIGLPVELANTIARLEIEGEATAGAVVLLDERWRRRLVGLASDAPREAERPLLGDLYYLKRALAPFSEIRIGAIAALLEQRLSVLVLADTAAIPAPEVAALEAWLAAGGVVVRFAGPRLAQGRAAGGAAREAGREMAGREMAGGDTLTPVRLRRGGRALGGVMSWTTPMALAPFDPSSPFAGLAVPDEVRVTQQVLAEPGLGLGDKTWARLADGTPLVTAERRGKGWLVLFHTTANTQWSNLALSGLFVDMLQRVVALSEGVAGSLGEAPLRPLLSLDGWGRLGAPPAAARAVAAGALARTVPGPEHPPGYYGSEAARVALNLSAHITELDALARLPAGVALQPLAGATARDLRPWLLAGGLALALIDLIVSLALRGLLGRGPGRAGAPATVSVLWAILWPVLGTVLWLGGSPAGAAAAETAAEGMTAGETAAEGMMAGETAVERVMAGETAAERMMAGEAAAERMMAGEAAERTLAGAAFDPQTHGGDAFAIAATRVTRLAYVRTGVAEVDDVSRAGLWGLSRMVTRRTSAELAAPFGVDIETDTLSFFPILYWPVVADQPDPSPRAVARLNRFLASGGTILFDTRDQQFAAPGSGAAAFAWPNPGGERLARLVRDLDIPPLAPVPPDHVVTKSFYLMQDFPGRWAGGTLWVEAGESRRNDGVSPVIIGANDWAASWAIDESGRPLFPVIPGGEAQRETAFRFGINLVMYMLTGNYKSDQVHVPAILERLGQ